MSQVVFLNVQNDKDKTESLRAAVSSLSIGSNVPNAFVVSNDSLRAIPRSCFAYWASNRVYQKFKELESFVGKGFSAWVGLQTNDDFRWLRLWWEVSSNCVCCGVNLGRDRSWVPFAKGGAYSSL